MSNISLSNVSAWPARHDEGRFGWSAESLVSKVAFTILLVGTGMAIVFAIASLHFVRQREIGRHLTQTVKALETVESTVRVACFTADPVLAKEVAQGLLTDPAVYGVRISSGYVTLAQTSRGDWSAPIDESRWVRRPVTSPFDRKSVVGEIVLVTDPAVIAQQAGADSTLFALLLLLQVLAVTVAVAFAVDRTVVRPIRHFAESLDRRPKEDRGRLPVPKGHERNEIGSLVEAFNRQMESLASLLDHELGMRRRIADSERRFRTLAENSPDIILRHDSRHRLLFSNPAFSRETGLSASDLVHESLEAPAQWRASLPLARYQSILQGVLDTGEAASLQWDWPTGSGMVVSHELYVVPEYDESGQAIGTLAMGRNITARLDAERRLLHMATHDTLTGLPNRALLKDRLQQAILRSARDGSTLAVLFVDLDRFKTVNDTLGHDAGDELLVDLAGRMRSVLRAGDTVARLGGDEFVILLGSDAETGCVQRVLDKIFGVLARPCHIGTQRLYVEASVGIALCPQDGSDIDTLMRNADTAMFAAKAEGRNTYRYFASRMNDQVRESLQMNVELREALENREFELFYQPKFDVQSGRLSGVESLIRWRHPRMGTVAPACFIGVAEECGLIGRIGSWVLDEACRQAKAWRDAGLPPVRVAVNLSATQCESPDLHNEVQSALDRHGLQGDCLELEITESTVMSNADRSIRAFWALRSLGVRLSVDDFGTGYSSLSYLKRLPVHNLKIDRSFIKDLEVDANSREIIRAVVAMAHSLQLGVIAEGVETLGQLDYLRSAGCDEFQGFLACRPVPAAGIEALLKAPRLDLAQAEVAVE